MTWELHQNFKPKYETSVQQLFSIDEKRINTVFYLKSKIFKFNFHNDSLNLKWLS